MTRSTRATVGVGTAVAAVAALAIAAPIAAHAAPHHAVGHPAAHHAAEKLGTTLYGENIAPLGYWDGVPIAGTGYGSAFTPDPNHPGYFYGLTDRGPNVTAPDGTDKLEPLLGFQDAIGYFHLVGGKAQLVKRIGLTLPDGEPMGGLENTEANAGETILDMYGDTLPSSDAGLDTEGIVAMKDGTFWISDEYGPYIVHFDASGKEISRYDPYATTVGTSRFFGDTVTPLPAELQKRMPNKGMEGLAITPDGKYLVGLMQSSLQKNGSTATASKVGAITRIVKISLTDPSDVHEYLYELHDSAGTEGEANSELTALPDGTFLVDERDGNFEGMKNGAPTADKNLWHIDLSKATDVGPNSPLLDPSSPQYNPNASWVDGSGLEIGGKTIEDIAGSLPGLPSPQVNGWQTLPGAATGTTAGDALAADGISVAQESLFLNYSALVSTIDPSGMYFGHDKVEGVAVDPKDPSKVYLTNDSDFGITDLPAGADPTGSDRAKGTDAEKFLPDGKTQDFGEVMEVDMTKVPARFKG